MIGQSKSPKILSAEGNQYHERKAPNTTNKEVISEETKLIKKTEDKI